jgi:6,7-dimethyl-8-ribityllumazine synthase
MNQHHHHHVLAATAALADRGGRSWRVAFVSSSWHRDLVDRLKGAALSAFAAHPPPVEVDAFDVPGAFEIPLHARRLAASRRYDAIVAAGLVVNGGIYRHEFVAAAVIDGLMRVQLDSGVPVLSAVLTPRDFHEHDAHRAFFADHLVDKGREVAAACLQTLAALERLPRAA